MFRRRAPAVNVLFIEDDRMNRRVVADMLRVAGVDMAEAVDGEEGVRLAIDGQYDLLLVDLRMPGMDGIEVIRRVRASAAPVATVPIIVVTADTAIDLRERCLAAGADDILFKPVAMDSLFETMGRLLAERGDGAVID